MSATAGGTGRNEAAYALESIVARMLIAGTWLAMGLVLVGVVLMLANGVDPLAHGAIPPFDPSRIPADLVALRPIGFLWAGIVLIIALPIGRVIVAGVGYVAVRDWRLVLISVAVFLVVLVSIVAAIGLEG